MNVRNPLRGSLILCCIALFFALFAAIGAAVSGTFSAPYAIVPVAIAALLVLIVLRRRKLKG